MNEKNALLTFCFAAMLSACGANDEEAEIRILIDWFPEPTYLGIYYAADEGFFAAEGIHVEFENVQGANRAVSALATSDSYLLSTASGAATVLSYNQFDNLYSLGVLYEDSATAVYGIGEAQITSPSDLRGKRVGIYPGSINNQEFALFLDEMGISTDEVEVVAMTGSDVALLLEGRVDAAVNYQELSPNILQVQLNALGRSEGHWEMRLSDYAELGYGLNIIGRLPATTEERTLQQSAYRAIVEGYRSGCENPQAAVDAFLERFDQFDREYVAASWTDVCSQLTDPLGEQSAAGWGRTIGVVNSLDLLEVAPPAAQDIMSPER